MLIISDKKRFSEGVNILTYFFTRNVLPIKNDQYKIVSSEENVGGYKKRYFSPTLEEQGMLLAMGKRGEEKPLEGNAGSSSFELNEK